jgi:Ca2+-binding RTX toxin-like protein
VLFNSGTIQADYAIRAIVTVSPPSGTADTLYNSGTLDGRVDLGLSDDKLYNKGTITQQVDLGDGNDLFDGRGGHQNDTVYGGVGFDTLFGGQFADKLDGGDGNDTLSGGGGGDTLTGGANNDTFYFASGDGAVIITDFTAGGSEDRIKAVGYAAYQSVQQQGSDTLITFSASDTILLKNVQAAQLTDADFQFSAPALTPTPDFPNAPAKPVAPVVPSLASDSPAAPIFGTVAADKLTGSKVADTIFGDAGNDIVNGDAGDDWLLGGSGNDTITGSLGSDTMIGGAGKDTFVYASGDGTDYIYDLNVAEGDTIVLHLAPEMTYLVDFDDVAANISLVVDGQVTDRIYFRGVSPLVIPDAIHIA